MRRNFRIISLTVIVAVCSHPQIARPADPNDADTTSTQNTDAARQRQLARIQRELGRCSRNMGPEAWYVLALHDAAERYTPPQRQGQVWRSTPRLEGVQITHFVIVQGKSEAAELIYEFLRQTSDAPGALPETTSLYQGRTAKAWEARGFRTQSQAASFYNRAVP